MRKWIGIASAVLMIIGVTGTAHAVDLPFTGTLSLTVNTIINDVSAAGTASVATRSGNHLLSMTIPPGIAATTGNVVAVTDPAAAPIGGLQQTVANGPGAFAETPASGPLTGVMSLVGVSKVCLFGPCSVAAANVSVPLSVVGQGGTTFATAFVNVTVTGAAWTTGIAAFTPNPNMTTHGSASGPGSAASSTAQASGHLRLVSPVFISTNIPASAVVPSFAAFDITFAPEPGQIALLASAVGTLFALGQARRRR